MLLAEAGVKGVKRGWMASVSEASECLGANVDWDGRRTRVAATGWSVGGPDEWVLTRQA